MDCDYQPRRTDPRTSEDLVVAALEEGDIDRYWEIVDIIRLRGTRKELEMGLVLCKSIQAEERRLGAQILGQLGGTERPFFSESIDALYGLLEHDGDPNVLESAAAAVGSLHPKDKRAINLIAGLKDHPDAGVRFGVAVGLLGYDDDLAIGALIDLSSDEDAETRDYATMGLSQLIKADTPEIRGALWRRVTDEDDSVRGEAMLGLAVRQDERVVELVLRELESRGSAKSAAVEAAAAIASPQLCSALIALQDDQDISADLLNEAIMACKCG